MVGRSKNKNLVHMIDFGLSKVYRDLESGTHIPFRDRKRLVGTARYASLNMHRGVEPTRRDDLESVAYMLFYFIRGSLPWQGLKATTRQRQYERIASRKNATPIESLCKGYPPVFGEILKYARSLEFEEGPDYAKLKRMLKKGLQSLPKVNGADAKFHWDWEIRMKELEAERIRQQKEWEKEYAA